MNTTHTKHEFSLLGAFLIGLLWLLNAATLRVVEFLDVIFLAPAQQAIVSVFVTLFVSPTALLVDAVSGTHWCSTARLHDIVTNLAGSLSTALVDWLHSSSAPSIPDTNPGFGYTSCSTQTSDDDFCSWATLEMFTDGLNHLSDFFDAGLQSVMSSFDGNTLTPLTTSTNHSPVALPSTPVRKQCPPAYQQNGTSPSISGSDGDAA